jgi:hypothetical protein
MMHVVRRLFGVATLMAAAGTAVVIHFDYWCDVIETLAHRIGEPGGVLPILPGRFRPTDVWAGWDRPALAGSFDFAVATSCALLAAALFIVCRAPQRRAQRVIAAVLTAFLLVLPYTALAVRTPVDAPGFAVWLEQTTLLLPAVVAVGAVAGWLACLLVIAVQRLRERPTFAAMAVPGATPSTSPRRRVAPLPVLAVVVCCVIGSVVVCYIQPALPCDSLRHAGSVTELPRTFRVTGYLSNHRGGIPPRPNADPSEFFDVLYGVLACAPRTLQPPDPPVSNTFTWDDYSASPQGRPWSSPECIIVIVPAGSRFTAVCIEVGRQE